MDPVEDCQRILQSLKDETSLNIQQIKAKLKFYMKTFIETLKSERLDFKKRLVFMEELYEILKYAWSLVDDSPAFSLTKYFKDIGGLDVILSYNSNREIQLSAAKIMSLCLTQQNRNDFIKSNFEEILGLSRLCTEENSSIESETIGVAIIENLLQHSEQICTAIIEDDGLETILRQCKLNDIQLLKHCAKALVNLCLFGGSDNQEKIFRSKALDWLNHLCSHDKYIEYYACLAIAVLMSNPKISSPSESDYNKRLITFLNNTNCTDSLRKELGRPQGHNIDFLQKLLPVLSSSNVQCMAFASFHFCMEAEVENIRKTKIFKKIGAFQPLNAVASFPHDLASHYAVRALKVLGKNPPPGLSQHVPLWDNKDVLNWLRLIAHNDVEYYFKRNMINGHLLLQMNDKALNELGITNPFVRTR